jgi:methylenetetrahydrofolate dehydrogenase (NADP+)/methenyltetrahydrofolate cyclohydrolase
VIVCIHAAGAANKGVNSSVVGASSIAGKPAALLLTEEMATVTMCHLSTRNLIEHTARADILVVAVDKPGLISANHVRPGATVIDVGINTVRDAGGEERKSWRAGSV